MNNPYVQSDKDILFVGFSRRKQRADGVWWDIYCDPIIEELSVDYLYAEPPNGHKKPRKTRQICHLDLIEFTAAIPRKLNLFQPEFTSAERHTIQAITTAFDAELGVNIDFEKKFRTLLSKRNFKLGLYNAFFNRIDPELVFVVSPPRDRIVVEASKQLGIPVVELQQGAIHPYHLAYVFPEDVDVTSYRDYLFTFGDFWRETVDYSLADENVYSVGYPYLEQEREKYTSTARKNEILFLSQPTVGTELSRFAAEFAHRNESTRIVYKLHPNEYERWNDTYPWLEDAPLEVVDDGSTPLYKILSESEIQVGVYSTAIYEGLCFGNETYLLDAPGVVMMEKLIQEGTASLVSSVEEFEQQLTTTAGRNEIDVDYFFKQNSGEHIQNAITEIIKKESEN